MAITEGESALLGILRRVTPVNAFGSQDLGERWGISPKAAALWMNGKQPAGPRASSYPPFPQVSAVNGVTKIVDADELEAWENAVRAADLPLPGERPRGPRRQS